MNNSIGSSFPVCGFFHLVSPSVLSVSLCVCACVCVCVRTCVCVHACVLACFFSLMCRSALFTCVNVMIGNATLVSPVNHLPYIHCVAAGGG